MSSPSSQHHLPYPRPRSPGSSSLLNGHKEREGNNTTPRSSIDYTRPSQMEASSSSSRRASQSSIHHSPTSSHHTSYLANEYLPDSQNARRYNGEPSQQAGSSGGDRQGSGGSSSGNNNNGQSTRLPRITTSDVDRYYDSSGSGPHSAPSHQYGSLKPLVANGAYNAPLRSASSPDPWLSSSPRGSPSASPTEMRPPVILGPPAHPLPSSRGPSPSDSVNSPRSNNLNTNHNAPPVAIPPRRSSHMDSNPGLASRSSQQSLADTSNTDHSLPSNPPSLVFPVPQTRSRRGETYCGQCAQVVHGQFVRAMGHVYHLNCFRCKDCNKVVAQKFFPVEEGDIMYPLCETDYFGRLGLLCAKCGQALRSSYITACGAKYHVEHFTCSECDTLFGSNDSYYEHSGKVYCHFHYSTKFAVKCVGCETAILKQFVEMNRNGRDECWHPECYMISKFWNVRLASKNFNTPANSAVNSTVSLLEITPSSNLNSISMTRTTSPASENEIAPAELKERQEKMEVKVQQIWHVLSGYEESSAALIGEMLRAVNGQMLLDIVLLAEKFILHVEVLFAVIDDLEAQFALAGVKGMAHAREAKQLCRKLVNLFSLMSQINPGGESPMNNAEHFTLITQLAHYLKILIRIALTGSIKLERDQNNPTAMTNCLARLNLLAMDNSDPTVKKRGDHPESEPSLKPVQASIDAASAGSDEEQLKKSIDALTRYPQGFIPSTQHIAYGYRSLAPEVTGETTLRGPHDEGYVPPEGCVQCHSAMEEDCVRYGMFNRWHSGCVVCRVCGDRALVPFEEEERAPSEEGMMTARQPSRRPPARVDDFFFEPPHHMIPDTIYCMNHQTPTCIKGFESVSRLEQYAFLLHIALRRLYVHFRTHHQLPSVIDRHIEDPSEVKRMKSVTLDRKLSSTARLPQRSMVVESPAGRMADENGQVVSARSNLDLPAINTEQPEELLDDDAAASATVDVLRPPFARNNTSVMIINENNDDQPSDMMAATTIHQEDDAITLGDISILADQAIRERSPGDERPLLCALNPLQSLIVRHFALLQLQKSGIGHLIELDEVLELLEARKSQWWNKIFKGNAKKDTKKKGVFGIPLEILVERTGSDSQLGSSNALLRVPEIIEDIISTMRQMDMAIEGIFRKNGNIRRLQTLAEALDKDSTAVTLSEENPVQLAALLKRFLREMPDPLLTFRLHKLFCGAASLKNDDDRRRCLHLLVILLPRANRDTMEVLFVFLKWVASFSHKDEETGSRMDMANLATVICPSILYAKGANAARDESFIAIQAVQDLLQYQDDFYHVPDELLFVINEGIYSIFAKELDLPPKEIHRHCSKYMQARGQPQRLPASISGNQMQFGQQGPGSSQAKDRSADARLPVQRSDGSLAGQGSQHSHGHDSSTSQQPIQNGSSFRQALATAGINTAPGPPSATSSRPTSFIQPSPSHYGSQHSLHQTLISPAGSGSTGGSGSAPWRPAGGPFQGSALGNGGSANGSRNSSRGSAPSSPAPGQGPAQGLGYPHAHGAYGQGHGHAFGHGNGNGNGNEYEGRRSFGIDRERTRTPVQMEHR